MSSLCSASSDDSADLTDLDDVKVPRDCVALLVETDRTDDRVVLEPVGFASAKRSQDCLLDPPWHFFFILLLEE